jgi:hypothetical protein
MFELINCSFIECAVGAGFYGGAVYVKLLGKSVNDITLNEFSGNKTSFRKNVFIISNITWNYWSSLVTVVEKEDFLLYSTTSEFWTNKNRELSGIFVSSEFGKDDGYDCHNFRFPCSFETALGRSQQPFYDSVHILRHTLIERPTSFDADLMGHTYTTSSMIGEEVIFGYNDDEDYAIVDI